MASTTITLNEEAYKRLKKLKQPGESFSDVILSHLYLPAANAGEVLERVAVFEGSPLVDERRMTLVEQGRKRRSKRA
jgi:predicted CopG family antitoxin